MTEGLDLADLDDDPDCERSHLFTTDTDDGTMRCIRCGHREPYPQD